VHRRAGLGTGLGAGLAGCARVRSGCPACAGVLNQTILTVNARLNLTDALGTQRFAASDAERESLRKQLEEALRAITRDD